MGTEATKVYDHFEDVRESLDMSKKSGGHL